MIGAEDGRNGTDQLVPAVYAELRRIAAAQMARLPVGSTLQPTALVHEAWMRLTKADESIALDQAHFFAVAAEAMRHILIDRARRRSAVRHGGNSRRVSLVETDCRCVSTTMITCSRSTARYDT